MFLRRKICAVNKSNDRSDKRSLIRKTAPYDAVFYGAKNGPNKILKICLLLALPVVPVPERQL